MYLVIFMLVSLMALVYWAFAFQMKGRIEEITLLCRNWVYSDSPAVAITIIDFIADDQVLYNRLPPDIQKIAQSAAASRGELLRVKVKE